MYPKRSPEAVRSVIDSNLAQKKQSQPISEHTAGCVFKNPDQHSAGRLLDAAGVKGMRQGSFYFSQKHANFLVHDIKNSAPGTLDDALSLIHTAKERVYSLFGIDLHREVIVWE